MPSSEAAEGIGRSTTTHQPPAPASHSSHISGEDLTGDTPVAVEPPVMSVSAPYENGPAGISVSGTPPMSVEGMDIALPLNDLSDDSGSHVSHNDDADEAAGFASSVSVGSLSIDDHLAITAAAAATTTSAAGDEASTTSAGTGGGSAVRGRRPSFQAHRRPSQRRRSSATSFEMHDSLIFEELNKLVEDDTDDSEEEEDENAKIPATSISDAAAAGDVGHANDAATDQDVPPINIIDSHNSSGGSLNNNRRSGRRGSSRSLASVVEDMELRDDDDDDGFDDLDNDDHAKKKDTCTTSSPKCIPVVMQFEQRILDRLEQQDDKRSLVNHSASASARRRSSSSSTFGQGGASGNTCNGAKDREDRLVRGSRAVQSERVLTGRAREVWPKIDVDVESGGAAGATGTPSSPGDDVVKDNEEKEGRNRPNRPSFIKSLFRGLGRKK